MQEPEPKPDPEPEGPSEAEIAAEIEREQQRIAEAEAKAEAEAEAEAQRIAEAKAEAERERERQEVTERQERLAELGWYEGAIDGIAGPMTASAREGFQLAAGVDRVGEVTEEYVEVLFAEDAPPAPEPEPEPEPAPAPAPAAPAASSGIPWDRLAQCESGQNWSINTGNSFYGGLQFNKMSWDWAGGQQYAEYPHQATREQQIATAEVLLSIHPKGIGAWPACARKLGLY